MIIGYLQIRAVDAIRYKIINNNNTIYFVYKNKSYIINLPNEYSKLSELSIVLDNSELYNDFEKRCIEENILKYIFINNKKVDNKNIINFNPFSKNV